jgi:ribose/xylose/arabinose/galactoside ABC-type transport system permease subunit
MNTALLRRSARPIVTVGAVVLIIILVGQVVPYFATVTNLANILVQASLVAVAALGMTLVLLTGGIDLSVGGLMSLVGVVEAGLIGAGLPWPLAVVLGLVCGAVIGLINGLAVAKLGLPSFIATFGTLGIAAGLALFLAGAVKVPVMPAAMVSIGNNSLGGVPYLVAIAVVALVGLETATRMTTWGVHLRATGNAFAVARLSGVHVERTLISAYLASGILSAAAGTLLAANLSTAGPLQGEPYTLSAVAACVIGGVDLLGGRGRLWAATAGAVFLAAVASVLDLQGVQPFMQGLVTGILIILAVFLTTRGTGLRLWFARSLRRLRFGVPQ